MKTWARWTLLILWTAGLMYTAVYWNPFTSFPALLKYSVISVISAAIFGALVILIEYYILISIIFPLPPRADAKAPKGFWRSAMPFLYKKSSINPKAPTTLASMIGNEEAKQEIREVIDMMQHPEQYEQSGAVVPKGMLFVGPPGVGKTLFARAIANEIGVPFYVLEGSNLSGMIFGLGVLKLKTLFAKLRQHEKAIVFIDEIDSMGASRQGDRGMGAVSDMNMTLNTLLTEMDGFHASNLLVIGATNNDGILDPALMRAGRMDRRIYFQTPNPEERKQIFQYYLSMVKCAADLDLDEITQFTANYSPAELANVVNEAALIAQRPGGPGEVTTETVKRALERISIGLERTLVGSGVQISNNDPSIRLKDVIGIDDVKQDVLEIIDFLNRGEQLRAIGAKVPKGLMLVGPPGVGKTMLAKAIANEAGVPFYGLSASYFSSMWAGEGAARIRAVYTQARKHKSAIVFIDEIDAIGGTVSEMGSTRTQELNQILIELDGIGVSNVITIGSTNNEQSLDPAFMRSGRFDRKAYVGLPDAEARQLLFAKYLKDIKVEGDVDSKKLGEISTNFSGADIAATTNEAAIIAVRAGRKTVTMQDLLDAVDRISVTAGHKLNTAGMNLSRVPDLRVKLKDVKGMEEAIAEAAEVVALLKHADKVVASGLKPPKGLLLVGPPGTGKTMLAKAIANEAGVPFYSVSGGDFQSMWAGVGSNRVRMVYEQARRGGKPCIVFIDEIDAIGGKRMQDRGGGAVQDSNKTLNQLLVEMDGFGKHKILTIGATNNVCLLDKALLRPGRFDRKINVPLPNLEGREAILHHYLEKTSVGKDVDARNIAKMTVWKSGADLENVVNEAGLIAIRSNHDSITQEDLFDAVQRVMFGMQYSRHILTDELTATAYHEAGHSLVCYYRNRREHIQVVTIVPRGGALGYMWGVEKEEYVQQNKHEYLVDIEVSLGGYAAENLTSETTTSGVSSDLRSVGATVSQMVRHWGMGSFKFNVDTAFVDHNYSLNMSSESAREMEQEMRKIVDGCLSNVENLLRTKRPQLDRLAHALLEKETLYYTDIASILEPERSLEDIKTEAAKLAERRLVGKPPVINLEGIGSLTGVGGFGGIVNGGAPGSNPNNNRTAHDNQPPEETR